MFHILDILVRIRLRILLFSSVTLRCTQKVLCLFFFEVIFTSFFKDKKSQRSHKTVRYKSRFFFNFLLVYGRVRIQIWNTDRNQSRYWCTVVSFPPLTEGAHASGTKEYLKESRDFCWSASSTHRRNSCFRHQRIYKTLTKQSRDFCWSASSTHWRSSCFRHQRI